MTRFSLLPMVLSLACASSSQVDTVASSTLTVPLVPRLEVDDRVEFEEHEVDGDGLRVFAEDSFDFAEGDERYPTDVAWLPRGLGRSRCTTSGTFEFESVTGDATGHSVRIVAGGLSLHATPGAGDASFQVLGRFVSELPIAEGCLYGADGFFEADVVLEIRLRSQRIVDVEFDTCAEREYAPGSTLVLSARTLGSDGFRQTFVNVESGRAVDLQLLTDAGMFQAERPIEIDEIRLPEQAAEIRASTEFGATESLRVVAPTSVDVDPELRVGFVSVEEGVVDGALYEGWPPWVRLEFTDARHGDVPLCSPASAMVESRTPAVCRIHRGPEALPSGTIILANDGRCEIDWNIGGAATRSLEFDVRNVDLFDL